MEVSKVIKTSDERHFVKSDYLKMSRPIDANSLSSAYSAQFLPQIINNTSLINEEYEEALHRGKYVKDVILFVSNNEPISHDKLAKLSHIHKSQLTRTLYEIAPFDFIAYDRLGNTKNYYLTIKGDDFSSYIKNKVKASTSREKIVLNDIDEYFLLSDYKKE